jgi:hypothetical protein
MTRREAWLSAGFVFALALAARIVAAAQVAFPVPEDTAYYAGVARNLVEGRGLISDALWSYQTQPLTVPRAAFEVWMPLPSLLSAIPMALLGTAEWFRAAQVMAVVAGAIVAGLAWRLGADAALELGLPAGRARTLAVGTGAVSALLGPLVIFGALPDSTALFTVLALVACLLITRLAAAWSVALGRTALDRRLVALGLVFGLTALTRSEAIWLGLAWLLILWRGLPVPASETAGSAARVAGAATLHATAVTTGATAAATAGATATTPAFAAATAHATPPATPRRPGRLRMVVIPTVVAGIVFAPWAVRDWLAFGTPLPGQAIGNALYTGNFDMFAWSDPPTLARYLAQGLGAIVSQHLAGLSHNLVEVLAVPAFPVAPIGALLLPRVWRLRSLRPLVISTLTTFLVTTLAFPVATQSGTFLHAAGPVFVLLVVSTLAAVDAFIAAVGRIRRWTRPVAWLGPAFAIAAILPLTFVSVVSMSRNSSRTAGTWEALPAAMAAAGVPLDGAGPVITNYPIWLAETARVQTLALPEESPAAVVDLAGHFGAHLLVIRLDVDRGWPSMLKELGPATECFHEVPLLQFAEGQGSESVALEQIRVYRILCP